MKKLFIFAVLLSLMLCACSGAPSAQMPEAPSVFDTGINFETRASHAPGATPYIHLSAVPSSAPASESHGEVSQTRYPSYGSTDYPPVPEEFLAGLYPENSGSYSGMQEFFNSLYERVGNFYFTGSQLEYFQSLPQAEPCCAVFHLETTLALDEQLHDLDQQITDLDTTRIYIYTSCLNGEPPEGYTYDFDRSSYPDIAASDDPLASALPLEYFEICERQGSYIPQFQSLQSESRRQKAFLCAELFSEAGCDAVVRRQTTLENGEESYDYLCVVTLTPERLWELSNTMDFLFLAEQLYPEVDGRFDAVVWPES